MNEQIEEAVTKALQEQWTNGYDTAEARHAEQIIRAQEALANLKKVTVIMRSSTSNTTYTAAQAYGLADLYVRDAIIAFEKAFGLGF